jgi:hypothetical protein
LQIDGETIALDDEALLSTGWHGWETGHRWTRGSAQLPPRARLLVLELAGQGRYWQESKDNVVALVG